MDNAATMRRAYELINQGDLDGFGELIAEGFVEHEEIPGLTPTKAGVIEFFRSYREAFPDLQMDAVDVIADGDKAVARVEATGTQSGEFMGMPPSGKAIRVPLIDIMRFDESGLVCEHWGVMDTMSMLQQLGALPDGASA
jgi:steroid delta-isomerase-like uncharacterized protein